MNKPFRPAGGQTVNVNVAATSGNVQVTSGSGLVQIRVHNDGSATAWIKHGIDNTVAATTTADIPVGPGARDILTLQGPVWMAAIAAGTTGKIYFTPGEGI